MAITFENVSHVYSQSTPYESKALDNVSVSIEEGKITAIIGQTGSGKSTLVQHLNALLLPTSGEIHILDRTIKAGEKPKQLKSLRQHVGLVFQFPEYQLFEETVEKDIAFGPKNFGASEEEAIQKAKRALKMVGLPDKLLTESPLEISGGQKRRVAIAGILAMDPEILVLDEPTAGLDPKGTKLMMDLFYELNKKYNKTIIIVTHDMEQVYQYCDNVIVLKDGKIVENTDKETFFKDSSRCKELQILPPEFLQFKDALIEKGFTVSEDCNDIDTLVDEIVKQVKGHE